MPPSSDLLLAPTAVKALLVIPVCLLLFTAVWHIVYYFNPAITINRPVAWHRAFNFLAVAICTCLSTKAQFNPQKDLRGVPFFQIVPVLSCGASQFESLSLLLPHPVQQLRYSLLYAIVAFPPPLATLAALVRSSQSVEALWQWAVGIIGLWTILQQLCVFGFCLRRLYSIPFLRNDPRARRLMLYVLLVSLGTITAAAILVTLQYIVHLPFSLLWIVVYPSFTSDLLLTVFWAKRLVSKWYAMRKEKNRVQQEPDIVGQGNSNNTSSIQSLVPDEDESKDASPDRYTTAAAFFI